ncbi:MAG: hypothetical protein IT427_10105 [Pirellulales bacterium]|nr:hypothetical protein [Pirellulales bacterium]
MDKVKQFLVVAGKHHFWILCGVAALIGLVVQMMASGKLSAETKARRDQIKSKYEAVKSISADHPNDDWNAGIGKKTGETQTSISTAWAALYEKQKQQVFVWPKSLRKDFLDGIAKVEEGKQADLKLFLRDYYLHNVLALAKELPKLVDAEVAQETTSGGLPQPMGPTDANGMPVFVDHRVIWDPQSQQTIFDTFTWHETPSIAIIRQAQEELWVYEALCKVIAEVNKSATGSHDASITGIQDMAVAYLAQSGATGATMGMSSNGHRVMRVKAPSASMGGDMMGSKMGMGIPGLAGGPEGGPAAGALPNPKDRCKGAMAQGTMGKMGGIGMMPGAPASDSAAAGGNSDDIWKGFRYVAEDGKPLATAAEVEQSPPEFNLMPFRVRLIINPKEIDELLIAFRNSTLPFEVREVNVGEPTGTGSPMSAGGGGMRGEFRGPAPMRSLSPESGVGGGMRMTPSATGPMQGTPGMPQQNLIPVEVSGVAYLLKKPDPSKLGITPSEGAAPADGTVPAPTPPSAAIISKRSKILIAKSEINSTYEFQRHSTWLLNLSHFEFTSNFGYWISDLVSRAYFDAQSV